MAEDQETGRSATAGSIFLDGESTPDFSAYSSIYDVYGADAVDISGLLRELKKNSYQDTGVEVGASDHIVTLSTCTGDGDTRMIVSAVRVDEHAR